MEAVILSGIQGAGKSTFCRDWYWDSHVRINYDMLHTRHREKQLLDVCLTTRQPLVIDATNPRRADRQRYLPDCKQAGFRIIGIEFRISMQLAIQRNEQRQGKAQVPNAAQRAFASRHEALSFAEGFDEIWLIDVTETGQTRHKLPTNNQPDMSINGQRGCTAKLPGAFTGVPD